MYIYKQANSVANRLAKQARCYAQNYVISWSTLYNFVTSSLVNVVSLPQNCMNIKKEGKAYLKLKI